MNSSALQTLLYPCFDIAITNAFQTRNAYNQWLTWVIPNSAFKMRNSNNQWLEGCPKSDTPFAKWNTCQLKSIVKSTYCQNWNSIWNALFRFYQMFHKGVISKLNATPSVKNNQLNQYGYKLRNTKSNGYMAKCNTDAKLIFIKFHNLIKPQFDLVKLSFQTQIWLFFVGIAGKWGNAIYSNTFTDSHFKNGNGNGGNLTSIVKITTPLFQFDTFPKNQERLNPNLLIFGLFIYWLVGYIKATTKLLAVKPSRHPLAIFVPKICMGYYLMQKTTGTKHHHTFYDGLRKPNTIPFWGNKLRRLVTVVETHRPKPCAFGDEILTKLLGGNHHA